MLPHTTGPLHMLPPPAAGVKELLDLVEGSWPTGVRQSVSPSRHREPRSLPVPGDLRVLGAPTAEPPQPAHSFLSATHLPGLLGPGRSQVEVSCGLLLVSWRKWWHFLRAPPRASTLVPQMVFGPTGLRIWGSSSEALRGSRQSRGGGLLPGRGRATGDLEEARAAGPRRGLVAPPCGHGGPRAAGLRVCVKM